MSIDHLQMKIRKMKSPIAVCFSLDKSQIPEAFFKGSNEWFSSYTQYAKALMCALKESVPAVRFSFASFSAYGLRGISVLVDLISYAKMVGFYILLDLPELFSHHDAALVADAVLDEKSEWQADGLVLSGYIGSDAVKPFVEKIRGSNKDIFLVLRTANHSAGEIQDLRTGSRLVHIVMADLAKRMGESTLNACGFSSVGGVCSSNAADSLRILRDKYPNMFLLVDGYDYSVVNAKNASLAFNNLGHGGLVCVGKTVVSAWQIEDGIQMNPIERAIRATERIRKNLLRYVSIW